MIQRDLSKGADLIRQTINPPKLSISTFFAPFH